MLVMYAPEQEERERERRYSRAVLFQLQIQEVCMHVDTRYYEHAPLQPDSRPLLFSVSAYVGTEKLVTFLLFSREVTTFFSTSREKVEFWTGAILA